MINYVYQLVSPKVFSVKYELTPLEHQVLVRPRYMAICHADQRYYRGLRTGQALKKKLPMALIHECCGVVVYDPTGNFQTGDNVVLIPNVPGDQPPYIYENYGENAKFLSSGFDGFMREYVNMSPERLVKIDSATPATIAAITEFLSVAVHAVQRMKAVAHSGRDYFGIWGDGSLGYVVASVIKTMMPQSKVVVIGKNKLAYFSFADQVEMAGNLPASLKIDHAFECVGGEGSVQAIDEIISHIRPQGNVCLMGVTENKVGINTRLVLEKGLSLVGCSRSGRSDFIQAAEMMLDYKMQSRLQRIVDVQKEVKTTEDIHRVFDADRITPFKTVFEWGM